MTGISYRSFSCNQDNQQLVNGVSKCMTACWCRYNSCDVHFICKKFVLYTERECCRNWCTHCVFWYFIIKFVLNLQLCRTMLDIITLFQVILIVTARKTKKWMIWKIFNRENNQSTFVCMLQKAIFLAKTVLTKKKTGVLLSMSPWNNHLTATDNSFCPRVSVVVRCKCISSVTFWMCSFSFHRRSLAQR